MCYGKPQPMSERAPSRLPTAFVRVSRCPICKYSLKDLDEDLPCPECGNEIDRDLISSPEMNDAIAVTRTWCTLGFIGWGIFAFGYWAYNMILMQVMNGYYPGTYGPNHFAGIWLQTASVLAPFALCISWFRNARRMIYQHAIHRRGRRAKAPKRVILVCLPGLLVGLLGCAGIVMMLSAV